MITHYVKNYHFYVSVVQCIVQREYNITHTIDELNIIYQS